MSKARDITGYKYNRLTAIKFSHSDKNYNQYWVFRCDCGNEIIARKSFVISGHSKSCGCLQKEIAKNEVVKHSVTHNESKTRLYRIWKLMHARCKDKSVKYYGAKGIEVCPEWSDYTVFKKWAIENGYKENLTIDRIDYNGNYEPNNCRWATYKEQAQNTSRNHFITHNSEAKCIAEWCRELNIKVSTFCQRMRKGLNPFTGERV